MVTSHILGLSIVMEHRPRLDVVANRVGFPLAVPWALTLPESTYQRLIHVVETESAINFVCSADGFAGTGHVHEHLTLAKGDAPTEKLCQTLV